MYTYTKGFHMDAQMAGTHVLIFITRREFSHENFHPPLSSMHEAHTHTHTDNTYTAPVPLPPPPGHFMLQGKMACEMLKNHPHVALLTHCCVAFFGGTLVQGRG